MPRVRLRSLQAGDLDLLTAKETAEFDPWNSFEIRGSNRFHQRFARDGGIDQNSGSLAVEAEGRGLIGSVSWHAVQHGPSAACRALNIGISLFPEHRGRGYGSESQRLLADYLFSTQLLERIEASTDVDNVAEQRSLEKAGFTREGILRHAQFRDAKWRDVVIYSRLRSDPD